MKAHGEESGLDSLLHLQLFLWSINVELRSSIPLVSGFPIAEGVRFCCRREAGAVVYKLVLGAILTLLAAPSSVIAQRAFL